MNYRTTIRYKMFLGGVFFSLCSSACLLAAVTASPKFLFLDGTRKSVPVQIANTGDDEREVWVEIKFGYVISDDSGKILLYMDSLDTEGLSAAGWTQVYPKRFILGPGDSQTIRLTATPPASLKEGEYWARVMITSKPRKPPQASVAPAQTKQNSGVVLQTQLGLAFHFRAGHVSTGILISDLNSIVDGADINVSFRLTRAGNASYWGTRTLRIVDLAGKVLYAASKNAVVYKSFQVVEKLTQQKGLPHGSYKIELELATGKRLDIRGDDLLQAAPVRSSIPLVIQ